MIWDYICKFEAEGLKALVRQSQPFPHFKIDNFLRPDFAEAIHACFPSNDQIQSLGQTFSAVNEKGKTQLTDSTAFPGPIRQLNTVLADPQWLRFLGDVMGIKDLLADDQLIGGGIHQTGPRGRLDVHVDFNYIEDRELHRRLNILIYFNKDWREEWGGNIELWDADVRTCYHSFSPIFNRCVVFATNDISYHGVTRVNTPPGVTRNSFAAYYYTKQAPPEWTGRAHSTIFKARPDEVLKGSILMPLESLHRNLRQKAKLLISKNKK